jgi:hypothetical protein
LEVGGGAAGFGLLWIVCSVMFGMPDALVQLRYVGVAVRIM